jgi:predicted DNA-binding protein with PD1-like motif
MKHKLLQDAGGLRTYALVLDTGDEAAAGLRGFAREQSISAARITAVGAFSRTVLRYFDWETRRYLDNPVDEQCEVAAFMGDIALGEDGRPMVHVHLVLGRRNGSALAGHLKLGLVRPTLEVLITESPAALRRVADPATGLALIDAAR